MRVDTGDLVRDSRPPLASDIRGRRFVARGESLVADRYLLSYTNVICIGSWLSPCISRRSVSRVSTLPPAER